MQIETNLAENLVFLTVSCNETISFSCKNWNGWRGHGTNECVDPSVICDGKQDCRYNDDEKYCSMFIKFFFVILTIGNIIIYEVAC